MYTYRPKLLKEDEMSTHMLEWWFNRCDQVCVWHGQEIPMYWLSHQEDHVACFFERNADDQVVGLRVNECFGRDLEKGKVQGGGEQGRYVLDPKKTDFKRGIRLEIDGKEQLSKFSTFM